MEYRRLGSTGMYVSEISYGNWITHGSQVEADAAIKCVKTALDCGITTFDTADVYAGTRAEKVLGKALKGVRRESYELFTKVYWPTGPGKNDRGLSRKHIIESCNASLKRLQTDHIDLYQMHRFDFETPLEESLSAFDDLIRAGKVHYIGFSEWTAKQIAAALKIQDVKGYNRFVSSQPQYSALWRVIEAEVVPLSEKEGIGQIVWSPMAQGVLTAVQNLKPIADEAGLTMSQLSVAWVLQNPNVSSAIVGATKPSQVKENVKAAGVKLDAETMRAIDKALGNLPEKDPAQNISPNPRA